MKWLIIILLAMNEVVTDYIVIHVVALSKKKSIGL